MNPEPKGTGFFIMLIKEFTDLDSQKRQRLFAELSCDICNRIFFRQSRFLKEYHTCSPQCLSILKGNRILLKCANCGERFSRSKSKLNNSRSGLYFCSRACKDVGQTYIPEIQPDHYGTGENYRKVALSNYGEKCSRCGYSENIVALEVHHKDRNRNNNDLSNLEVLCSNCHKIEHYGGCPGG